MTPKQGSALTERPFPSTCSSTLPPCGNIPYGGCSELWREKPFSLVCLFLPLYGLLRLLWCLNILKAVKTSPCNNLCSLKKIEHHHMTSQTNLMWLYDISNPVVMFKVKYTVASGCLSFVTDVLFLFKEQFTPSSEECRIQIHCPLLQDSVNV